MKISKIDIKNYHQFKDFTLDLTYPKGHPKAGKPLDKICFIGQSGTGKTTLLNLAKNLIRICVENTRTKQNSFDNSDINMTFNIGQNFYSVSIKNNKVKHSDRRNVGLSLKSTKPAYMNFPADIKHDINFNTIPERKNLNEFIDLTGDNIIHIWLHIYKKIKDFQKKEAKFRLKLTYQNDINIHEEIKEWKQKNESPLQKIAKKFLNGLLSDFSLVIDQNIKDIDNINFIQIKRKNGKEIIPFEKLSTGTKQIILSLVPLYSFYMKNAIILIDEPERSLFPDIQRKIISEYINLAGSSQFFFATHSPIVASQFEPCERFILKFDDEGNVTAIKGNAPEGDDPNDLLIKDFGLETVLTKKGLEMWNEFIETRRKIEFENVEDAKVKLINKYMKIGTDYNFAVYEKNQER